MANPRRNELALWSYISGQDYLYQYNVTRLSDGTPTSTEIGFALSLVNTSAYLYDFKYTTYITSADYNLNTNLARFVGSGVTKTFVQLATPYFPPGFTEGDVTNVVFDIGVNKYQGAVQGNDPECLLVTYRNGAKAQIGSSFVCIFSGTNGSSNVYARS